MFGLYIVEAGSEPVALMNREGKPIVFDNGTDAACAVRFAASGDLYDLYYAPVKCQPRRIANDAWKARELGRFADGTYVPLPWAELLTSFPEHFPHVSTEDGAKIAYTQDAAKGAGDIQTRVRPGKYLTQFYGLTFDAPTIARMAAEFSNQYGESNVLLFATTADDFERVYTNGPSSCMSYKASHFSSPCHPVRVYAGFDLQLAYMERDGNITARALVWPDKKIYSRIYGDDCRLTDLFDLAGYKSGSLDGAKITKREHKEGYVIPYLDGLSGATDHGAYLKLGDGPIAGDAQNGLSGRGCSCSNCSTDIDEDDAPSDDHGNYYCGECHSELFGYCERTEETCERDGMREVITQASRGNQVTQDWSEYAVSNYASRCEGNRAYYCDDLIVVLEDGTSWSQDYFADHGFECEGNGGQYSTDDLVQLNDGTRWSQDYFDDHGVTVDGEHYAKGDAPQVEADDAEEALETATATKPYRGSPTFKCDAQVEMVLNDDFHIVIVQEYGSDKFQVHRGTVPCGNAWYGRKYAERDLEVLQGNPNARVAA